MAAKQYVSLTLDRSDEMCTTCWRCAMLRLTITILTETGVSSRMRDYCRGCEEDKKRGY